MKHLLLFCVFLSAGDHLAQESFDWRHFNSLKDQGRLQEALRVLDSAKSSRSLQFASERQKLLFRLQKFPQAQQAGEHWIRLAEELGDPASQLEALDQTAQACQAQHKYEPATGLLRKALALAGQLGQRDREIILLTALAHTETSLNRHGSAATLLDRAEGLWREKRDPAQGARLMRARGVSMWYQGHLYEALPFLEEARHLAENADSKGFLATILSNVAQVHTQLHDYAEAIRYLRQALDLDPASGNRTNFLSALGVCYFELNQFDKAAEAFKEVLALAAKSGNRGAEAWGLGELGLTIWEAEGDAASALNYIERSAALFLALKDVRNALAPLSNKAMIYRDQGRWEEALRLYRQIEERTLAIAKQPEPNTYKSIGQCLAALGRFEEAEPMLLNSVRLAEQRGDSKRVWQGQYELARLYDRMQRTEEADRAYQHALEAIESLRQSLQVAAFKTDFFTDKVRVYEEYSNFLLKQGPRDVGIRRAFEVTERARARSLLDALAESKAGLHEMLPAEVRQRERDLLDNISRLQAQLREGQSVPEIRTELQSRERELDELYVRVRTDYRRFGELRYPRAASLQAIQSALRSDEVLLQYMVGEEASFLWLVDAKNVRQFALPGRVELESSVQKLLSLLVSPASSGVMTADVANMLLPAEALDDKAFRSLIVVPSGILYYLPLEILPEASGAGPLVEKYQATYLPSASLLVELRSKPPQQRRPRLLALGDPVYEGAQAPERTGALLALQSLGPLPHTRAEVEAVRGLFGRLWSTVMLGTDATEQRLKALDLRRFSVVHLAAHGVVDASAPSRSGLVLGRDHNSKEDGILQVREMFRLPLNASLVTLSACQSALGKLTTGEGMVGLTRALLYAGADTVVASLWNVNDEATARFMEAFYRFLKDGHAKAEALRRAKLVMIEDARLRHPYYWAGYVLIGEGSNPVEFPPGWLPFGFGLALLALVAVWLSRAKWRR